MGLTKESLTTKKKKIAKRSSDGCCSIFGGGGGANNPGTLTRTNNRDQWPYLRRPMTRGCWIRGRAPGSLKWLLLPLHLLLLLSSLLREEPGLLLLLPAEQEAGRH